MAGLQSRKQIIKSSLPEKPEFLINVYVLERAYGQIGGVILLANADSIDKTKKYDVGFRQDPWNDFIICKNYDNMFLYDFDLTEMPDDLDPSQYTAWYYEIFSEDGTFSYENMDIAVLDESGNPIAATYANLYNMWYNIECKPFEDLDSRYITVDNNNFLTVDIDSLNMDIEPRWWNIDQRPFDQVDTSQNSSLKVENNYLKYKKNDIDCWGDVDFEFQSDTLLKVTGSYHAYVPESKMTTTLGGLTYKLRLAVTFYSKNRTYSDNLGPSYMAFVSFDSASDTISFDKSMSIDTTALTRSDIVKVGLEFVYVPDDHYNAANPENATLKAVYMESNWQYFKRVVAIGLHAINTNIDVSLDVLKFSIEPISTTDGFKRGILVYLGIKSTSIITNVRNVLIPSCYINSGENYRINSRFKESYNIEKGYEIYNDTFIIEDTDVESLLSTHPPVIYTLDVYNNVVCSSSIDTTTWSNLLGRPKVATINDMYTIFV